MRVLRIMMLVTVALLIHVFMSVPMFMLVSVLMFMSVSMMSVDIEFPASDILPRVTAKMSMEFLIDSQRSERVRENRLLHAEIAQSANRHVSADARKTIEI